MKKTKPCKFKLIVRAIVGMILFTYLLGLPSATYSAGLELQWNPPTANTDGSPLVNLSHYRLYYGFASYKYTFHITTNQPIAYVNDLIAGSNYYFAVMAVDSNNVESDFSEEFIWNQTPALEILTSANAITVPEGSTSSFQVKLNAAPVNPTTVTVSWLSGDTDITVHSGDSLMFTTSSWNTYQTVTLSAVAEPDRLNGVATIRCSATGTADKDVKATEQDNTPALEILTSANALAVPEGNTASFQIKLNTAPVSPTTVTVSRVSGDTNIIVQSGTSLVFNACTWNTYQTVTLLAAVDADRANDSAIIRCRATGVISRDLTATEQDKHAGAGNPDERECARGAGR